MSWFSVGPKDYAQVGERETVQEKINRMKSSGDPEQIKIATEYEQLRNKKEQTPVQKAPIAPLVTPGVDKTATQEQKNQEITSDVSDTHIVENIDRRARLRPKPGAESYVYGDSNSTSSLLSIFHQTNGMVFPTTPTIVESHAVQYSSFAPTHSATKFNNFDRTDNVTLQLSGDFYVTNATEARYLLACIHFLRSITKMDFGRNSKFAGTPPPVLLFSAYGTFMYNDIPVIVKGASFNLEPDIDYIQVPLIGTKTDFGRDLQAVTDFYIQDTQKAERVWVPSKLTITLSLEQQATPDFMTNDFNLDKFKRGDMLIKGGLI